LIESISAQLGDEKKGEHHLRMVSFPFCDRRIEAARSRARLCFYSKRISPQVRDLNVNNSVAGNNRATDICILV
jgi:hypothetical protein